MTVASKIDPGSGKPDLDAYDFDVFISYSRKDLAFARSLEKALRDYRPPRVLDVPQRHLRVFRDEADLVGATLTQALEDNLRRSAKLLVISSLDSKQSRFVGLEIETFARTHRPEDIITVMYSPKIPSAGSSGEIPGNLFHDSLTALTAGPHDEPLAEDFRGFDPSSHRIGRGAFRGQWFGILARLYGRSRATVEQREAERQKRRRRVLASAVGIAFAVLAALAVWALIERARAVAHANVALSRQLAAQAFETSGRRLDLALLLNLQALSTDGSSEVRTSLARNIHLRGPLKVFLTGHKDTVWGAAFSRDGHWMASGGQDKSLMLWDLRSPHWAARQLAEAPAAIRAVAFSPSGNAVAAGDEGSNVIFASVRDGGVSRLSGHRGKVRSVAYRPDGARLASAGEDGLILIWDAERRTVSLTIDANAAAGGRNEIRGVSFSSDGSYLVSGGRGGKDGKDGKVLLWDAGTGRYVRELGTHDSPVQSVAFSQDGGRVASSHEDGTVIIWDMADNREVARMKGSDDIVYSVAFVRDGQFLASAGEDRVIVLWDAASGQPIERLKGHEQAIYGLAGSGDGNTLASASFDRHVILWDVSERSSHVEFGALGSPVRDVSYSPDASRIAGVGWNGKLAVWDAATGRSLTWVQAHGEEKGDGHAYRVVYSPDGAYLATCGSDGLVAIWDAHNFARLATFTGHKKAIRSLAFSPDSRTLASGDRNGKIILWDVKSGEKIKQPTGHNNDTAVYGLAYSSDGKRLVSSGFDGRVIVRNASTGEAERELAIGGGLSQRKSVRALAISPDGATVASGDTDGVIIVWNLKDDTKRKLWHEAGVEALAYSADGSALVSAGGDRALIVWNTGDYSMRAQLKGHDAVVYAVSFNSKSPNTIVSGGLDRKLRIWTINPDDWRRAACDVANRNLTCAEWQAFVGAAKSYRRNCDGLPYPLDLNSRTATCIPGAGPAILQ